MNLLMKKLMFTLFILVSFSASAQIKHTVQPKETLYGLASEYKVSQEDILNANPFINEKGLQIGDVITIPEPSNVELPQPTQNFEDANYQYITIQAKETLYNLSKTYDISIESLKSINPSLSEGLKIGDVVRIPKTQKSELEGYHQMQAGETLYSISRKYKLSIEDLLLANRDLQIDNIPIGAYIKIPSEGFTAKPNDPVQVGQNPIDIPTQNINNGYYQYTVKKDETVFTLLNNFDITLDEFITSNPNVKSGIQPGEVVNIPLKNEDKFQNIAASRLKDDTIRVTLFLPFFLDDDSKIGQKEVATTFLSGAKLALDSLSTQGKKLKINVIDSGNEYLFEQTLDRTELFNANLFVGPFYKNNILALRRKTNDLAIPIVSPLLKDATLEQQPNIIFAEVDDYTLSDKIIEEIQQVYSNQKIYLLTDTKKQDLAVYIQEKLSQNVSSLQIVKDVNEIQQEQNLITEAYNPIMVVLVSESDQLGDAFIEKIDALDHNNTLPFSVFYLNSFDKRANIEKLRKKGFVFVANRKVNLNGFSERNTLKYYEKEYCQSPPKFAVIGFDIVYDLLTRMDDEHNVTNHLVGQNTTQLATKFEYERLPSSSFVNKGVRVVRYTKL